MSRGPTLINLPPPPSDPTTPSELGPGTPNSTHTSLSTLSVVAIKDGSLGHGPGSRHTSSANTLEAERADRISRLAGLERVATARQGGGGHYNPAGVAAAQYPPSYFDNVPQIKERSTVGSASATGSVGGRTTWASGSIDYDADKMSEDQDDGVSSAGGFSDEDKASLVGFGEGAGSTVSGPVSTASARAMAARHGAILAASPSTPRSGYPLPPSSGQSTPMSGVMPTSGAAAAAAGGSTDPRMMDGISYDANIVDSTMQPGPPVSQPQQSNRFSGVGTEVAEGIMRERLSEGGNGREGMNHPDGQGLGRFPFERDQGSG